MASYEMVDGKRVLKHRTKIPGQFLEDLPDKKPQTDPPGKKETKNDKPAS